MVLEALTYMSIVTLANVVLGKVGSFVMLVFMLLQLAGSAGTYPIELSNGFYEKISQFLPMNHANNALRQEISIGDSILKDTLIFVF